MLSESENYTCSEYVKTVARGCDVQFTLKFNNGYTFKSTSYKDTCTQVQVDIIRQYMRDGDELIYFTDFGSPYLLMIDLSFDLRVFRMVESNYDLLATLNMQNNDSVLLLRLNKKAGNKAFPAFLII